MNKFASAIVVATAIALTAPSAFAADVSRNDRLFDAEGRSVAKVTRVESNGDVLVIYKGKVRRIASDTLSDNDGKLVTSLLINDIRKID